MYISFVILTYSNTETCNEMNENETSLVTVVIFPREKHKKRFFSLKKERLLQTVVQICRYVAEFIKSEYLDIRVLHYSCRLITNTFIYYKHLYTFVVLLFLIITVLLLFYYYYNYSSLKNINKSELKKFTKSKMKTCIYIYI